MDDATSLGSRRLYPDQFAAIVQDVLATMPPPRLGPGTDLEAAAADLARRLIAAYPYPRQRPLIGFRAIIDAYGMDSSMGVRARFQMGLHDFGLRYRGQRHREEAGLPAPLVEEPDMDAAAAELLELFKLRHRGVEARRDVAAA
jgi:hypothetical protein